MPPAPPPPTKRKVAEDLVRNFDVQRAAASSGSATGKKPRFDARNPSTLVQTGDPDDEDDQDNQTRSIDDDYDAAILELDEIGRSGAQAKRNAVRLEGYDSDSSNEGFNARAEERARAAKAEDRKRARQTAEDNEDDDMFADAGAEISEINDGKDADEEADRKRKKEVRFMDTRDIAGQVESSRGGGHVSADFRAGAGRGSRGRAGRESDSDISSADDEERDRADGVDDELGAGGKKTKAPKLDAFNMRSEAQEGRFDADGNFVRKAADPFAVHDAWIEGTSRNDMNRAREAHEQRELQRRQRDMADDAISTSDILDVLIRQLEIGETALEALARYGAQGKKSKPKAKWQQKKKAKAEAMDVDVAESKKHDAEEQARKDAVESITSAADQLLTRGQDEVYEMERELLMRQYKRETGQDWADERGSNAALGHRAESVATAAAAPAPAATSASAKQWEYQWADARDGGEVHGPYDGATMASWNQAGYFGQGVQFRESGAHVWRDAVPDFV